MRKNGIRKVLGLLILCASLFGLAGCSGGGLIKEKYDFKLSCFPAGTTNWDVYVAAYDADGEYLDEEKLGTIYSLDDVIEGSAKFSKNVESILVAILDRYGIRYYISLDATKQNSFELSGWWFIYYQYGATPSQAVVGVSPHYFTEIELNEEIAFDFTTSPIYALKISNAKDKVFKIDAPNIDGVEVYASDNVENVASYASSSNNHINSEELNANKTAIFKSSKDNYYLLFRPEMYDDDGIAKTKNSAITITEITAEARYKFPIDFTFTASDGTMFMTKDEADNHKVYTYDADSNKEIEYLDFADDVIQIEETDAGYYFVAGKKLTFCDKTTKVSSVKLECEKNIDGVLNLNNTHMIVSSDYQLKMYDQSDFATVIDTTPMAETDEKKKETTPHLFYVPGTKTAYYLQRGNQTGPDTFYLKEVQFDDDYKFTSPKRFTNSVRLPVKQIGDSNYVIEYYNDISKFDDGNNPKKIFDYSPNFKDLYVYGDYIYVLATYEGSFDMKDNYLKVYKFNKDTFAKIEETEKFENETGHTIYASDKGVYILTNTYESFGFDTEEETYAKLHLIKLDLDLKEDTGAARTAGVSSPIFYKNAVDISELNLENFR